jgi:hypothetical protein
MFPDDTGKGANLSFIFDTLMFEAWSKWIDANGATWFWMDIKGVDQAVRFVTPIQYNYDAFDRVRAVGAIEVET